ncbi:hypothetical protein CBL_11957 [Carabus blaptoides fortunei]
MGRDGAGPRSQRPAQLNTGLAAAAMIHRSYLNYSGPGGRHVNNGHVRLHSAPFIANALHHDALNSVCVPHGNRLVVGPHLNAARERIPVRPWISDCPHEIALSLQLASFSSTWATNF